MNYSKSDANLRVAGGDETNANISEVDVCSNSNISLFDYTYSTMRVGLVLIW